MSSNQEDFFDDTSPHHSSNIDEGIDLQSPTLSATTASAIATCSSKSTTDSIDKPTLLPIDNDNATGNKINKKRKSNENNASNNSLSRDFRGGQDAWESMFYKLMVYKVNHDNDTNVKFDKDNTPDHALYLWLQNQRKHYKYFIDGKPSFLNTERIKILENVGVEWNVRGDVFWENMLEKLKEYKSVHGDTLVPRQWEENKKLGEWVTDQRRQMKYKTNDKPTLLTDERERKLNEIGFAWSLRIRTDWNDRFEELMKFRQANGHCIVPQLYEKNKALGKWVSKQREQYRRLLDGKYSFMTQERVDMLNELGFSWNAKGRPQIAEIETMKPSETIHPPLLETGENIPSKDLDEETSLLPIF